MSYPGQSVEERYPSAEMQSVYSTAQVYWAGKQVKVWKILIDDKMERLGFIDVNERVICDVYRKLWL